jgi:dihydrodipicolinate synthase/N-acetylneuraminate lyase
MTRKLTRHTLKGFVPAIVTPFAPDGAIVEDAFGALSSG